MMTLTLPPDYYSCVADWSCNEQAVRGYLARYVTNPYAKCETYARTHYGGPYGASQDYTLDYWHKVESCLNRGRSMAPKAD